MPKTPPLTLESLAALQPAKLAGLLWSHAQRDQALWDACVLALAEEVGGDAVSASISARFRQVRAFRGFHDWRTASGYAQDLDTLRRTIAGVAEKDAAQAATLMAEFLELEASAFDRCDDSSGALGDVFRRAVEDWGNLWTRVPARDPRQLAELVLRNHVMKGYGVRDRIIAAFKQALGREGLVELRRLVERNLAALPPLVPETHDHDRAALQRALQEIADAENDPDEYVRAHEQAGTAAIYACEIAERMLAAARPDDALRWLDGASTSSRNGFNAPELRERALGMLMRHDEAQALRWSQFEKLASASWYQKYVSAVPTPQRASTRTRAMAAVSTHPSVMAAVAFLIALEAVEDAGALIVRRRSELEGQPVSHVSSTAGVLAKVHPLAATILLRAEADDILRRAQSRAYPYAARNLQMCTALAPAITDWSGVMPHAQYMSGVKEHHALKRSFWREMGAA